MVLKIILSENYHETDEYFEKSFNELEEYFNFGWTRNIPLLFLIESRKEMDLLEGRKTEDWCMGTTKGRLVFIFSPESLEKETCHTYEKNDYLMVIKHELVHVFTNIISKNKYFPDWFWEGLAVYLSGQNNFKKKVKEFKEFLKYYDNGGSGVYYESGFAIELLINKLGKDKLMDLIFNWKNITNKEEFDNAFKKIYDFEPNYETFNKLLK
ncbi:MAG: hypothetical protein PHN56_03880 [Candidatus Nanoarchaeia archaeon]|nr:hypothetical protein [Candidatus Nanoarchaeia archaeon]